MSKMLDDEIEMMEREDYRSPRWQRGLAWLRELRHRRLAEAVTDQRCDWRSLFVLDPATGITSLQAGATLDDVAKRLAAYHLSMAESEQRTAERAP